MAWKKGKSRSSNGFHWVICHCFIPGVYRLASILSSFYYTPFMLQKVHYIFCSKRDVPLHEQRLFGKKVVPHNSTRRLDNDLPDYVFHLTDTFSSKFSISAGKCRNWKAGAIFSKKSEPFIPYFLWLLVLFLKISLTVHLSIYFTFQVRLTEYDRTPEQIKR